MPAAGKPAAGRSPEVDVAAPDVSPVPVPMGEPFLRLSGVQKSYPGVVALSDTRIVRGRQSGAKCVPTITDSR